jgi:hypothetical protein
MEISNENKKEFFFKNEEVEKGNEKEIDL